jgi:hypothetical protein
MGSYSPQFTDLEADPVLFHALVLWVPACLPAYLPTYLPTNQPPDPGRAWELAPRIAPERCGGGGGRPRLPLASSGSCPRGLGEVSRERLQQAAAVRARAEPAPGARARALPAPSPRRGSRPAPRRIAQCSAAQHSAARRPHRS